MLSRSQKLFFTAALYAAQAAAQTDEEIAAYPDMAQGFAKHGITWESVKVTTDNGYILTAFHITGSAKNGPFEITKPALVMQHGMGGNSNVWTQTLQGAHNEAKMPMAY